MTEEDYTFTGRLHEFFEAVNKYTDTKIDQLRCTIIYYIPNTFKTESINLEIDDISKSELENTIIKMRLGICFNPKIRTIQYISYKIPYLARLDNDTKALIKLEDHDFNATIPYLAVKYKERYWE